MAIPKYDKHKDYVRYATHCLNLAPSIKDQDNRVINREMAAEWLKLADAVLHLSGITTVGSFPHLHPGIPHNSTFSRSTPLWTAVRASWSVVKMWASPMAGVMQCRSMSDRR